MVVSGILSLFLSNKVVRAIVGLSSLAASVCALLSLVFSFSSVSFIGVILLALTIGAFIFAFLSAGRGRNEE